MNWIIPGTTLEIKRSDADHVGSLFASMFMAGGMVLGQVASITGLEPYTVQNWVKRGFLSPPVHKRYDMGQVCRIININMLKSVLPMEQICGLLGYINGDLDDESDDIIDDSQLYFMFIRLVSNYAVMHDPRGRDEIIARELDGYQEPMPGARDRVEKVLRIFITAWASAQLRRLTEQMVAQL